MKPFDRRTFETRLRDYAALRGELEELDEAASPTWTGCSAVPRRGAPSPVQTPKGIAPETLELVRRTLEEVGPDGLSATECSERTGLAGERRRYLEQLVAQQEADVRQRYGTAGRPERRFTPRAAPSRLRPGAVPEAERRGRNDRYVR